MPDTTSSVTALRAQLTEAQKAWLQNNPEFRLAGPPRKVFFLERGNLYADGTYEELKPGVVIQLSRRPVLVAIYDEERNRE